MVSESGSRPLRHGVGPKHPAPSRPIQKPTPPTPGQSAVDIQDTERLIVLAERIERHAIGLAKAMRETADLIANSTQLRSDV
jgi:hypothetical protein